MASQPIPQTPGTGIDEKGGSTPSLAPFPNYQATWQIQQPSTTTDSRRSRSRRCCTKVILLHALALVCVLFFFPTLVKKVAIAGSRLFGHNSRHTDLMSDETVACVANARWNFDPDEAPLHGYEHVAQTFFELPASSSLLLFLARGRGEFAHGSINFVDSPEIDAEVVKVDVTAYYNFEHDLTELTKVCVLQPKDDEYGVGIFGPRYWHPHDGHNRHRVQSHVTVQFPVSSSIKRLETDMPLFAHGVSDLADTVSFESVHLRSSNMPIGIGSLAAPVVQATTSNSPISGSINVTESLNVHTSNGPITGSFTSSESLNVHTTNGPITGSFTSSKTLELHTTNAHIRANVSLLNDNGGDATWASLSTSNSPISTNLTLYSTATSNIGGKFQSSIKTSNSPLDIVVPYAPVDHILHLTGHTSNSPVRSSVYPTFEGSFKLASGPFSTPVVRVAEPEDPAGRGRRRRLETSRMSKREAQGRVTWEPSERTDGLGHIDLSTSLMGVELFL